MRLKLKTAIKEEEKEPKVQELMPTLTNASENHTKKVNITVLVLLAQNSHWKLLLWWHQ